MLSIFAFLCATLGLLLYWNKYLFGAIDPKKLKGKKLPGPKGYPLIGSILELGKEPEKQFCKWREEYGDMFQVNVANFRNVVVSDPKLLKEIMNDPASTGRMLQWASLYEDTPNLGVFIAEGELWSVHRRFMLRQLRQFGFGKNSMESLLMNEVIELIKLFRQKAGTSVGELRETMRLAVVNSLWSIVSSERFNLDDPTLMDLSDNTSKKQDAVMKRGAVLLFIPWIRHVFPGLSGYTGLRAVLEENKSFFQKSIQEHKRRFQKSGGEINDFIDVFLAEMKIHENDPTSHFYGEMAERQLTVMLFDMFVAGSDTTAMSSAWAILYLCKFPQVQVKLQAEIKEITNGDTRLVSLADRPNMPYATAVIDEVYRYSSIAAIGLPHRLTDDIIFNGYLIPKNTQIIGNLYYIHHSREIWGDPENFRPERFISEDGKKFVRNEALTPFLIGKRICPGEQLARNNIFLILTNLFQRFSIKFDPDRQEPGFDGQPGFLKASYPFNVIMTDRMPNIEE